MTAIPLQEALVSIEPAVQQVGQSISDARDKLQDVRASIGILNATSGPKLIAKQALSTAADAIGNRVRGAINLESGLAANLKTEETAASIDATLKSEKSSLESVLGDIKA
jgi:signal transduction histidine kinase